MAFILGLLFTAIVISSLSFLLQFLIRHKCRRKDDTWKLTNWPVFGMLPGLLCNLSNMREFRHQILKQNGWTFVLEGPWFANMELVFTSDPVNIHHIHTKNFTNYPKGQEVREIFSALGDGIFNVDSDSWKIQRKYVHSMFTNRKVELYLNNISRQKVEKGLFSVLEYVSERGKIVDMQDVFKRFTFDTYWQQVLGLDLNCLSVEFPENLFYKAFDEVEEAIFHRTTVPPSWWKLQKWLQIGSEKKFVGALQAYDEFLYEFITQKQEKLSRMKTQMEEEEELDLLTASMAEGEGKSKMFLRDLGTNLLVAGRDTVSAGLTWFFWLLATHPSVENKILEEIKDNILTDYDHHQDWLEGRISFNSEQVTRLVYLHAALCETLRLYPPIPINYKSAAAADTLPSGHHINKNAKIMICFYVMGRMEEVWGEDCSEFKPERWISENGSIVHVPSYKFSTFGAGPRACLGRNISFIQMKMVAASVIWNYRIQVAEGHLVEPTNSIVLFMKHGLKVRVVKRSLNPILT